MKQLSYVGTVALLMLISSGCAVHNNKVTVSGLHEPRQEFVLDRTSADDYPSFAFAAGNIYSCRFGIRHQPSEAYDPPKPQMFGALMASAVPGIQEHTVTLERFDVYVNQKLKIFNKTDGTVLGIGGKGIKEAARTSDSLYTFGKVLIDINPMQDRRRGETKIGCDDKNEGEYYASEVYFGEDVIVTWLKFQVDKTSYHLRSFFPFKPENEEDITAGISEAIKLTFEGIAPGISG